MDLDPVFLSRVQFAFVVSFHIIFPAFTIGLAAWLATIEGAHLFTGREVYRRVFDFWLKVFVLGVPRHRFSFLFPVFPPRIRWSGGAIRYLKPDTCAPIAVVSPPSS